MTTFDFSPLYRTTVGFDRFASLLNHTAKSTSPNGGYPPYNIEVLDENQYAISIALSGFRKEDIQIQSENNVLTVSGKQHSDKDRNYLYQGIAAREFERKFQLADFVEVVDAKLENGLLDIQLVKRVPDALKPKTIEINSEPDTTRLVNETVTKVA